MIARQFNVQLSITTRFPMSKADIRDYLESLQDNHDFKEVSWHISPITSEGNFFFDCECGVKLHFKSTEGECPMCHRMIRLEHQGAYPRPSVEKTVSERYEDNK